LKYQSYCVLYSHESNVSVTPIKFQFNRVTVHDDGETDKVKQSVMVLLVYILYHIIDGALQDAHLAAQYTVQVRTPLTDPNSRMIPHVADGRS
jgi:hypothetical protein